MPDHYEVHRALPTGLAFKQGLLLVLPSIDSLLLSCLAVAVLQLLCHQNCSALEVGIVPNMLCHRNIANEVEVQKAAGYTGTVTATLATSTEKMAWIPTKKVYFCRLVCGLNRDVKVQVVNIMLNTAGSRMCFNVVIFANSNCNVRVEFKQLVMYTPQGVFKVMK